MSRQTRQQRHYWLCLLGRTAVFLLLLTWALTAPEQFLSDLAGKSLSPLLLVWLLLMLAMVRQFFPSRLKSLGSQKLFASRCRPRPGGVDRGEIRQANWGALRVLLVWVGANAVIFLLSVPMSFGIPVSPVAASVCFGWTTFLNNGFYRI